MLTKTEKYLKREIKTKGLDKLQDIVKVGLVFHYKESNLECAIIGFKDSKIVYATVEDIRNGTIDAFEGIDFYHYDDFLYDDGKRIDIKDYDEQIYLAIIKNKMINNTLTMFSETVNENEFSYLFEFSLSDFLIFVVFVALLVALAVGFTCVIYLFLSARVRDGLFVFILVFMMQLFGIDLLYMIGIEKK